MPILRPLVFLVLAATAASGADPKPSVQAQLAAKDAQVQQLRTELDAARSSVAARIDVARAGLETANRALETRVDQARADAAAERVRSGDAREQLSRVQVQLAAAQAQLGAALRDRSGLTQTVGKLTEAQVSAQKLAARAVETQKATSGQLATASAELASVHGDTVGAIQDLTDASESAARAQAGQNMDLQRTIEQQRVVLWGTLGTGFFTLVIALAGLVAKDRIDKRHIREIGFIRSNTEAVSSHVLQLDNSLGELFPEIRSVVPPVDILHAQPKTKGTGGVA